MEDHDGSLKTNERSRRACQLEGRTFDQRRRIGLLGASDVSQLAQQIGDPSEPREPLKDQIRRQGSFALGRLLLVSNARSLKEMGLLLCLLRVCLLGLLSSNTSLDNRRSRVQNREARSPSGDNRRDPSHRVQCKRSAPRLAFPALLFEMIWSEPVRPPVPHSFSKHGAGDYPGLAVSAKRSLSASS